ncbi:hypothetical protein LZ554_003060 [Drepanopeziza brunnea f. sp. 'monogermtubi']|nr:hypothetical protein LZ554_003060 [Drepanopeziza brunnea f. sp. 'monogermtubi']
MKTQPRNTKVWYRAALIHRAIVAHAADSAAGNGTVSRQRRCHRHGHECVTWDLPLSTRTPDRVLVLPPRRRERAPFACGTRIERIPFLKTLIRHFVRGEPGCHQVCAQEDLWESSHGQTSKF